MNLLITVVPASRRTGRATTKALLAYAINSAQEIFVQGVYRDLARVPEAFLSNANFKAVRGDVSDAKSLDFSAPLPMRMRNGHGEHTVFIIPTSPLTGDRHRHRKGICCPSALHKQATSQKALRRGSPWPPSFFPSRCQGSLRDAEWRAS